MMAEKLNNVHLTRHVTRAQSLTQIYYCHSYILTYFFRTFLEKYSQNYSHDNRQL